MLCTADTTATVPDSFLCFYFSWVKVIVLLMGCFGSYMPTYSFQRAESLPGRAELGCNSLQHTHTAEKTPPLRNGPQWAHKNQSWRSGGAPPSGSALHLVAPTFTMPLVPHGAARGSSKVLLEMWDISLLPSHPHTINKPSRGLSPLRF